MAGFELWTLGIGSDRSAHWAITTGADIFPTYFGKTTAMEMTEEISIGYR